MTTSRSARTHSAPRQFAVAFALNRFRAYRSPEVLVLARRRPGGIRRPWTADERALERAHRPVLRALRHAHEQAVDHRQLCDPAGHGTRAEGRLAGSGRQHQAGVGRDSGASRTLVMAMVVAPPASATRSASTVSVVVPVCEMAMATSAGPEQRGGGQRGMRVGPDRRQQADAVQLLVEVLGHEAAGADAVDVDALGARDRVDGADSESRSSSAAVSSMARASLQAILATIWGRLSVGADITGRRRRDAPAASSRPVSRASSRRSAG